MAMRRVELFGLARVLASAALLEVDARDPSTVRAVLAALALRCPELVGPVLQADLSGPVAGYSLNVNGRSFVEDLDAELSPGDVLLLLPAAAGG